MKSYKEFSDFDIFGYNVGLYSNGHIKESTLFGLIFSILYILTFIGAIAYYAAEIVCRKNYSFSTVLTKFNNGSLDDIPYINNVYKALDIVNYYNSDIEAEFNNVCLNLKPDFGAFLDFLGEQKITQIGSRFFDEFFYYNEFSKQNVENSN